MSVITLTKDQVIAMGWPAFRDHYLKTSYQEFMGSMEGFEAWANSKEHSSTLSSCLNNAIDVYDNILDDYLSPYSFLKP